MSGRFAGLLLSFTFLLCGCATEHAARISNSASAAEDPGGSGAPRMITKFIAVEFVVFQKGTRISGYQVLIGDNPRVFYLILRDGKYDRLVDSPVVPTFRTTYQGTPYDKDIREDPEKRFKRVMAAPRIDPGSLDPRPPSQPGREPLNILPAFILTLPLTGPSILAESAMAASWKSNQQKRFARLAQNDSQGSLEKQLGKPFRRVEAGKDCFDLHFGPITPLGKSPELADRKIVVRFQYGKVWGAFSDDFYRDP